MREPLQQTSGDRESLEKEATHTLEEARMVLPGVQTMFGFQLIAVYNKPFTELLSHREQQLHLAGLLLTAVAIALLMTPAAYHRQAEPHRISRTFTRLSSTLLTLGMFTLMLSIQADCYLIARIILQQKLLSFFLSLVLGLLLVGLWFVLPGVMRWRHRRADAARLLQIEN